MAPKEFTFIVYVTPTGSLYGSAGGKAPAVDAVVVEDFDRAAPKGTGSYKLAGESRRLPFAFPGLSGGLLLTLFFRLLPGNYAPVLKFQKQAKEAGYAITLHLDSKTRTHIDEFSTSNALGIKKASSPDATPTLVVPRSDSILKSVTTKSLVDIAKSLGWNVELRPVPFQEVIDGGLEEFMACGTAAVRPSFSPFPLSSQIALRRGKSPPTVGTFLRQRLRLPAAKSPLTEAPNGSSLSPHAGHHPHPLHHLQRRLRHCAEDHLRRRQRRPSHSRAPAKPHRHPGGYAAGQAWLPVAGGGR